MSEITLEEYKQLVQERGQALMDVIQSVSLGDTEVEIEIPEGVEIFSDLAVGVEMMVDDLRQTMAELQNLIDSLEDRVADRTHRLEIVATLG
jgi:methyl-accepting chemotaxis protein